MRGKQVSIDVSQLKLTFGLNSETISPLFYERTCTATDYDTLIYGWKNFINYDPSDEKESLLEYEPNSVADVISLVGLLHSTGAWDEVAEMMVYGMGYSYSDLICFRDDVFAYLDDHDFLETDCWCAMESVRKGQGLPFFTEKLVAARDKWVLARLQQVQYLFPKAHLIENLIFRFKAYNE